MEYQRDKNNNPLYNDEERIINTAPLELNYPRQNSPDTIANAFREASAATAHPPQAPEVHPVRPQRRLEPATEPPESDNMFDEFEYEDKVLDKAKGYFSEVLSVSEADPKDEPIEAKLEQNIDAAPLSLEDKEKVCERLYVDKDIFARNINDLGQTDIVTHEINTETAAPIKQAPYCTALCVQIFIKQELI
ncbi:38177_t:CDS:2 [Gigaspora margarita]|uniref:38177_t:CDS:1 n=1 Tax=Gigaspora margarita TaxID=4874 RepID=A0ABM8W0U5_GIGMA|nr:38177_t:CDS:2 [Gigaspora margarita]